MTTKQIQLLAMLIYIIFGVLLFKVHVLVGLGYVTYVIYDCVKDFKHPEKEHE